MVTAILAPEFITLTALVQRPSTVIALAETWPLEERSRALVFYALMGGFELPFDDGTSHQLTYSEFRGLVRARFVDAPIISTEEVDDKSKGNWFTKSLALLQIGWFVIQLLSRVAQHLETTPLELFTLGVVACTIISYIYWWAKPVDVNTSTPVSKGSSFEISKRYFLSRWRFTGGEREFQSQSLIHGSMRCEPSFHLPSVAAFPSSGQMEALLLNYRWELSMIVDYQHLSDSILRTLLKKSWTSLVGFHC